MAEALQYELQLVLLLLNHVRRKRMATRAREQRTLLCLHWLAVVCLVLQQFGEDAAETPHVYLGTVRLKQNDLWTTVPSSLNRW